MLEMRDLCCTSVETNPELLKEVEHKGKLGQHEFESQQQWLQLMRADKHIHGQGLHVHAYAKAVKCWVVIYNAGMQPIRLLAYGPRPSKDAVRAFHMPTQNHYDLLLSVPVPEEIEQKDDGLQVPPQDHEQLIDWCNARHLKVLPVFSLASVDQPTLGVLVTNLTRSVQAEKDKIQTEILSLGVDFTKAIPLGQRLAALNSV
jgi:hypothetical protein